MSASADPAAFPPPAPAADGALPRRRPVVRALGSRLGKSALLLPVAFLAAIAANNAVLGIIFYAGDVLQASPRQIGLLGATWSLSYVLACLLLRPRFARLLPRHSMLLATVCSTACLLGIVEGESLLAAYVFHGLFGVSLAFFWPPLMGWLSVNAEGEELGRRMGRFNLFWSSGAVIGPMLAGTLAEIEPTLPLRVAAGVFGTCSVLIVGALLVLTTLGDDDEAHARERRPDTGGGSGAFLRFPSWVGLFAAFVAVGVLVNIFPVLAERDLHMTKRTVGVLLFGRALMNLGGLTLFGRVHSWHYEPRQLVLGLLGFAVVMGLFGFAESTVALVVLLGLAGALTAQSYANSLFHGVSGSSRRAERMALHESLLSCGLICGGAVGGFVYQAQGRAAVFFFCALTLVLASAVQVALVLWHGRRSRRRSAAA